MDFMDKNNSKILIIEDDQDINDILYREFSSEGYEVLRAWSGTEGRLCLTQDPDIIITDLMLPGMSGEELVAFINDGTPVIVLSAKSSVEDKVKLLKLGCVDYVTKPFNINELKARVEVHLANSMKAKAGSAGSDPHSISFGGLTLDSDNRTVTAEGGQAHLTRTEFAILKLLLLGRGTVISKNQILESVGVDTPDLVESSIKVHISNIRRKIKALSDKEYIESVWGIGFRAIDSEKES